MFKHILLSSVLVNNRIIVIENKQKNFRLQLQLSSCENLQLQLQQNRVINYNFVNYNYNFSKPEQDCTGENETYGCRTHFRSVMNY